MHHMMSEKNKINTEQKNNQSETIEQEKWYNVKISFRLFFGICSIASGQKKFRLHQGFSFGKEIRNFG